MSGTILAVGADGKCAGLVIPALAARGAKVRGLVRKPGSTAGVRDKGAAEVAIGVDEATSAFLCGPSVEELGHGHRNRRCPLCRN
jgi:uncharacterized protein YbjT (DUF2867 family)